MNAGRPVSGFAESFATLARMQKPARGVSLYSTRINRPAGRLLAALAAQVGASPNQVTLLGLGFSLAAMGLIVAAPGALLTALVLGPVLAVSFALDSADGQLARLQGSGGPAGEWLDHMVDAGVKLTLHLAVAVAWIRADRPGLELLLPVAFQVVGVLMFVAVTLGGMLRTRAPGVGGAPAMPARAAVRRPVLRSVLLLPVDYGALCLLFLIWAWPPAFRAGYAALLIAQIVFMVPFAIGLYRELSASGAHVTAVRHPSFQTEESSS
jgi:phosphatidylglycerophosphate synthase